MKKKILFILLACLVASGIMTKHPLMEQYPPEKVILRSKNIKGFDKRNKYLIEQARRLFNEKNFKGAILVADELNVGANVYNKEASMLIIRSEEALRIQRTLEAGKTEEAKASLEASTK